MLRSENLIVLKSRCSGRDNNFLLIRIVAAFGVLLSHSYALASGNPSHEPLRMVLGMSLGAIAVDVFFISSGFLVGGSLFANNSAIRFLVSRVMRIYPALLLVILLTVFILGPAVSSASVPEFFAQRDTWLYLVRNTIVVFGVSHTLPGVFLDNPYRAAVNGSLWTLPYEIWMYCILFGIWLLGCLTKKRQFLLQLLLSTLLLACFIALLAAQGGLVSLNVVFLRLFFLFFAGLSAWLFRDRILLGTGPVLLCVLMLGSAWWLGKAAFFAAYCLGFSYLVLYLALVPKGAIRNFNRVGDYSYGFYIFAFPIQQLIAMLLSVT